MSFLRSKSRSSGSGPAVAAAATASAAAAPAIDTATNADADAADTADAACGSGEGKTAAVVGSGISGLATAWLLQQNGWRVTLYECEATAGGHSLTDDSAGFPVDLGFQVFNMTTYPHLVALLERLRIETEPSDMSFSLSLDGGEGLEWSSHGLPGLFVQKSNALSPKFLNMIREVARFGREAPEVLSPDSRLGDGAFGDYLRVKGYSDFFIKNYVLPMCAAVWSVPQERVLSFPARMLVRFWANHHLLDLFQRPVWRVVAGRSRKYVDRIVGELKDVRLLTPVRKIIPATTAAAAAASSGLTTAAAARKATSSSSSSSTATTTSRSRPTVVATDGERSFDAVVLATHSDTSLKLLKRGLLHCGVDVAEDAPPAAPSSSSPSGKNSRSGARNPCSAAMRALSAIPYDSNAVYLHTDASLMPKNRAAWASWNCLQSSSSSSSFSSSSSGAHASSGGFGDNGNGDTDGGNGNDGFDAESAPVCVTYWLNRLQRLPPNAPDTFVTLNPPRPPCARKTLRILDLDHPVFGPATPEAQSLLQKSQGQGGIFYAGAWCGYGFHEDGMASAVSVVRAMGGDLPWDEFLCGKGAGGEGGARGLSTPAPAPAPAVLPPRVPSPKLSVLDRLAIATFDKFARSAVTSGRLTVILPNGEQLDYGSGGGGGGEGGEDGEDGGGDGASTSSPSPLTAPLTRPGEEWRGAPVRRATLRVVDAAFFRKVILRHDTGLGEAYMSGDFEVDDLGALMAILAGNARQVEERRGALGPLNALGDRLLAAAHAARANTRAGSRKNIEAHYDAGNDMYRLFLDETMTYSSALHAPGRSLKDAQLAKLDALLDAAGLRPGDDVLEIGCGWGSLALRALERFPFLNSWTGLTLSKQQLEEAGKRVSESGERIDGGKVRLLLCDYRDCPGPPASTSSASPSSPSSSSSSSSPPTSKLVYDAVLSCEMVEAVGHEHLPEYFSAVAARLRAGGRAVLQAISVPDSRYDAYRNSSDFIREHVFPGGHLVSMGAMASAARPFGLAVSAAAEVGPDYACTLREWRGAWERPAVKKELIAKLGYPTSFWRKYRFYFAYCEAGFDARYILNYQVAFTKLETRAGEGTVEGRVGGGASREGNVVVEAAATSAYSSSSAASPSLSPLLLALLSWVGGALAIAAATLPSLEAAARLAVALTSLAASVAALALVARGLVPERSGSSSRAAAAATAAALPPLAPPASLDSVRVNGKLPAAAAAAAVATAAAAAAAAEEEEGNAASSAAELAAAEE